MTTKKPIAEHPTEGAIYQDDQGRTYHVAPDGTETEIELLEDTETAHSDISGGIYECIEDANFAAMIQDEHAGAAEPIIADSWALYQRVQAEREKRNAWAMGE